jgi:hypothetical protein
MTNAEPTRKNLEDDILADVHKIRDRAGLRAFLAWIFIWFFVACLAIGSLMGMNS